MPKELPSPEVLRKIMRYEPETGKLFWRERPSEMFKTTRDAAAWNTRYSGSESFTATDNHGYRQGDIFGVKCRAHRVIWAIVKGVWPVGLLDHEDRDRANNRIGNLRPATRQQNSANSNPSRSSTSKYLGVSWNSYNKRWAACIRADGRNAHIGYFKDEKDAARAYDDAANRIHGEYAAKNICE